MKSRGIDRVIIWKQRGISVIFPLVLLFILSGCGGGGGGGGNGGGGTINLAWEAPTTHVDRTPLDLAGYRVYVGVISGIYGTSIDVKNVTTYTLTGLTPGQTYYISVTAYDTDNNESGYSNEVSGSPR